jgi:hypothetical protein
MSRKWKALTACTFVVVALATPYTSRASKHPECELIPIKPIQCVRGAVIDISGARITNAKLTILQGEKQVATMRTSADGKFSFDSLEPGDYVIQVEAKGLLTLKSSITVLRSSGRCRQALEVVLGLGMECDTRLEVVDAKQVR